MSRSIKKHPFISICVHDSNKWSKRQANKKFRHLSKIRLASNKELPVRLKEVSDVWSFPSDGLAYYISIKDYEQLSDHYYRLFGK